MGTQGAQAAASRHARKPSPALADAVQAGDARTFTLLLQMYSPDSFSTRVGSSRGAPLALRMGETCARARGVFAASSADSAPTRRHRPSCVRSPPAGMSALQLACLNQNHQMLRGLLKAGADTDLRSRDGWEQTALHIAAASGFAAGCRLLLAAGANPTLARSDGRTAQGMAAADSRVARELRVAEEMWLAHAGQRYAPPPLQPRGPLQPLRPTRRASRLPHVAASIGRSSRRPRSFATSARRSGCSSGTRTPTRAAACTARRRCAARAATPTSS